MGEMDAAIKSAELLLFFLCGSAFVHCGGKGLAKRVRDLSNKASRYGSAQKR